MCESSNSLPEGVPVVDLHRGGVLQEFVNSVKYRLVRRSGCNGADLCIRLADCTPSMEKNT